MSTGTKRSSAAPIQTPSRRTPSLLALVGLSASLAACATPGGTVGPSPSDPGAVVTREGVTPPFMAGRRIVRVGLLLPFSSRPADASALYSAAELALFDHGGENMLLIPRDSGGDEAAAAAAGQALVRDGADVIIGPVLREGVEGVAGIARRERIPVIGFSSDRTVAGDGVYLLSFQLEDEVARLVAFAATRNIRTIALLAPENEYGRRVEQALRAEAQSRGVTIVGSVLYPRTDSDAMAAATRMAQTLQATPAQGIVIAETGSALRVIGPSLVRAGINPRQVQLLGTSAWASGDAQREPTFAGGWYVAPDPTVRSEFERRYRQVFNVEPSRLASLSYDAVSLAALLSTDVGASGLSRTAIERSDGFLGSDGVFRFRNDGSIERGLAIMEVRQGQTIPIDPAPRRFAAPAT